MKADLIRTDNNHDGRNYWLNTKPIGNNYNDAVAELLTIALRSKEEIDFSYSIEDGHGNSLSIDSSESGQLFNLVNNWNSIIRDIEVKREKKEE